MRMTGEECIAASRSHVWEALNDPNILRQCIPGCRSLEREAADSLRATVEIKIGPIGARFNGLITLSDIVPPRSYTLTGEGQGGTVGSAKSNINVQLAEDSGATMPMTLKYDLTIEADTLSGKAKLGMFGTAKVSAERL
jgi:carbon monoxide dehydrogenase subunit G